MTDRIPEEMTKYLQPTEFCDCNNEEIIKHAHMMSKGASTSKEKAIKIFYFVRDKIPFGVDSPDTKASVTLKKGYGYCVTKTNLQIALLRSIGIPSRYHQVVLNKEILKGILPNTVYKMVDEKIWYHPWCECYLSDKWIPNDTVFDKRLYESLCKYGIWNKGIMPTIDWDGETELIPAKNWLLEDVGTHENYDAVCKKILEVNNIPKAIFKIVCYFSNRYISKIRK